MPAPLAVFRMDGGLQIGGGHVVRCRALADGLRRGGWRIATVCRASTQDAMGSGTLPGGRILAVADDVADDPAKTSAALGEHANLLVIDHYGLDESYERDSRSWADTIMVLDDLPGRTHDSDILLNPSILTGRNTKSHTIKTGHISLTGPAYAPLRDAFVRARGDKTKSCVRPVEHLFISFGATDPANATSLALDAVAETGFNGSVDVVLSGVAPHLDDVRAKVGHLGDKVRLHTDPENLVALLTRADLAIGAPGSSAWERCCLAIPTIMIQIANNQAGIAAGLDSAGAADFLGPVEKVTSGMLAEAIVALMDDPVRRADMATKAGRICDGLGTARVRACLAGETTDATGTPVRLRVATMDDAPRLLDWQSHPETRLFARYPEAPDPVTHQTWMHRVLGDPARILCLLETGDQLGGSLRLDTVEDDELEISIYTAPSHYRRGIAAAGLRLARRLAPGRHIHAHVLPENAASHALFTNAGYSQVTADHYVEAPQ